MKQSHWLSMPPAQADSLVTVMFRRVALGLGPVCVTQMQVTCLWKLWKFFSTLFVFI